MTRFLTRFGLDLWPSAPVWRRAIRVRLPFKLAIWVAREWR